jgi:hypothetical protein
MTLPAAIADKIAAINPRFASDHDGEVVACARAIERTLRGAGADWHDLVATFRNGAAVVVVGEKAPPPRPAPQPRKPNSEPKWDSLSISDRIAWLSVCVEQAHLSAWEQGFAENILASLRDDPYRPLSPKQKTVLNRIIRDAFNCGYRA